MYLTFQLLEYDNRPISFLHAWLTQVIIYVTCWGTYKGNSFSPACRLDASILTLLNHVDDATAYLSYPHAGLIYEWYLMQPAI